jgi:outer membrane lipoprotein carrier protein
MYKKLVSLRILIIGIALSGSVFAGEQLPPEAESSAQSSVLPNVALTQLRAKLNLFEQFSAQFQQRVFDVKGQQIQISEGELQVQQPSKFRWQTYEPDQNLIVSDGQAVWIYNTFVEQVTAMELNKTVQQSPLWLIANQSDQAWSQFTISHSELGYSIVPNDPNSLTKRIIIRFNGDNISQLVIEDTQGQSSEFNLSDFNATPTFNPNLFNFVMPSGVDFDDQREAK